MHAFLNANRDALIERCKIKVSHRPQRAATSEQLANGVPLFLEQLTRILEATEIVDGDLSAATLRTMTFDEIGSTATAHGKELLQLGFSVDQVVYDYGDLSQALAELAHERLEPFTTEEFRTLNQCIDHAIAFAVMGFSSEHDAAVLRQEHAIARERLGFLVHELRNALGTATLAVSALELSNMTLNGSTGAVLKRSLGTLNTLITRSLAVVRSDSHSQEIPFAVADLLRDAEANGQLNAVKRGCTLLVHELDSSLMVRANRELIQAALGNLVHNALKFTRASSEVKIFAHVSDERVLIEVSDQCGGLPQGGADLMFSPFNQRNEDKSGLGLGLSIARQSIEADLGALSVRDLPGIGCVFTISLPLVVPPVVH